VTRAIRTWVFDLDNTLYPAPALYDAVGERMTAYIARAVGLGDADALSLREHYFHRYGATVVGLCRHHGVDARDFLAYVHDVDHAVLTRDDELAALIEAAPGRKIVFTNGGGGHGERVLKSLGLAHLFERVFDIEAAGLSPKPERSAYERLIVSCGLDPTSALMIEDTPRNLAPAHDLGFATALVGPVPPVAASAYVHHWAPDVKTLLTRFHLDREIGAGRETR
jgi:putative hydrolase of the HAD superfamily